MLMPITCVELKTKKKSKFLLFLYYIHTYTQLHPYTWIKRLIDLYNPSSHYFSLNFQHIHTKGPFHYTKWKAHIIRDIHVYWCLLTTNGMDHFLLSSVFACNKELNSLLKPHYKKSDMVWRQQFKNWTKKLNLHAYLANTYMVVQTLQKYLHPICSIVVKSKLICR
jgi:hypothetical protein